MSESDRFDQAIEKLMADQSPRSELSGLDAEEQRMLRMAQLLRGSMGASPRPDFVETLYDRVFKKPHRVSRRVAFLSGLSALAVGLAAGVGLDRATQGTPSKGKEQKTPIVGTDGRWVPVAQVADVPHGAIRPFTAGAVQGFIMNRNGQFRALSRICTHMGCTLSFKQDTQALVCPCHGAEFTLNGYLRRKPRGYRESIPPLPEVKVRVNGQAVEVWTV